MLETNADVLVFPAKRYYEDKDEYTYLLNIEVDRERIVDENVNDAITYMLEHNIYKAAAWNKVVKKDIINKYNMRFKEGYLSEDMDWCGDLLLYSKRFDFYGNPFYAYRQQRAGSITGKKSDKLIQDKLYMCEKGINQAENLGEIEKKKLLLSYYAYEYSVLLGVASNVRDKQLRQRIRSMKKLLDYDTSNKVKQVNKLKRLIGFDLTSKCLQLFVRLKH